jgi:hypothetical protein
MSRTLESRKLKAGRTPRLVCMRLKGAPLTTPEFNPRSGTSRKCQLEESIPFDELLRHPPTKLESSDCDASD